jgi:hypothetical protein
MDSAWFWRALFWTGALLLPITVLCGIIVAYWPGG